MLLIGNESSQTHIGMMYLHMGILQIHVGILQIIFGMGVAHWQRMKSNTHMCILYVVQIHIDILHIHIGICVAHWQRIEEIKSARPLDLFPVRWRVIMTKYTQHTFVCVALHVHLRTCAHAHASARILWKDASYTDEYIFIHECKY